MIKLIEAYKADCDGCGEHLELDNVRVWANRRELSKVIQYCGWIETEHGYVYCENCIANENTELKGRYSWLEDAD